MSTVFMWALKGAGLGGLGAIGLFVAGFFFELMNIGIAIITCDCDAEYLFDWSGMFGLLLFCIIGGAIVGAFYGFYLVKVANDEEAARLSAAQSEEARRQRIKWAGEVKQKVMSLNKTCSDYAASDTPLISADYKANAEMSKILNELNRLAETEGQVDALAEELSGKGEASV